MHDDRQKQLADSRVRLTKLWMRAMPVVASFIASTIRNSHDADDLLQEVALAVAEDFDSYDPQRPFVNWAVGIARLRVLAHLRRRASVGVVFSEAIVSQLADASAAIEGDVSEMLAALDACLDELPDRGRAAIRMRYMQSMDLPDVAESMGVNSAAAAALLYRARQALLRCVQGKSAGGSA